MHPDLGVEVNLTLMPEKKVDKLKEKMFWNQHDKTGINIGDSIKKTFFCKKKNRLRGCSQIMSAARGGGEC